jgi:hypothetical protein
MLQSNGKPRPKPGYTQVFLLQQRIFRSVRMSGYGVMKCAAARRGGFFLWAVLGLTGCGGGGGGSSDPDPTGTGNAGNTTGEVTLTGDDTSVVGTTLDTGYIASSLKDAAQPDYIIIVDKNSSVVIENSMAPEITLADPENGFVINVSDDTPGASGMKFISMGIVVDGTEFSYTCYTPNAPSWSVDCGGLDSIDLDIPGRTVSFTDTTVINTVSATILTLNGTLTWEAE